MKKSTKIIIIIAISSIILGVFAIAWFFYSFVSMLIDIGPHLDNSPEIAIQKCKEKSFLSRDICLALVSAGQEGGENCDLVKNDVLSGTCYTLAAARIEDINLCNKIENKDLEEFCIAHYNGDVSYCKKIFDIKKRNDCKNMIEKRTRDINNSKSNGK